MLDTTIFATLAGSHAHGTSGPRSDIDLRGVCIAPLSVRLSLYQRFEQFEGTLEGPLWNAIAPQLQGHETARHSLGGKVEAVIYDVAKFLKLCASANPSALEILFADERDWLYTSETWKRIYDERHRFLTRKIEATYLGYGLAQLKKLRLHRGWLLHPPEAAPTREAYGLRSIPDLHREDSERIERGIADKVRREARRAVATTSFEPPIKAVRAPEAERQFRVAQKHWDTYETWRRQRNPARAELERRYGYDTKHAAHLLRLLETGLEIIQTGELRVRRQNASQLVAVINGAMTFDQLFARAEALQAQLREATRCCTLRNDVDRTFVDNLLVSVIAPGETTPPDPPVPTPEIDLIEGVADALYGRWISERASLADHGLEPEVEEGEEDHDFDWTPTSESRRRVMQVARITAAKAERDTKD